MDPNSIEATLRRDIEQGIIEPGSVLKQEQLAARFGVSRQPIRQILQRLLAIGLVERRSDRSLAVSSFSATQARELIGLRVALETSALCLSLPHLDASDLRKARHATDELRHAVDDMEIEELDARFHRLLYGRCGNDRMLRMIEDLRREGRRNYKPPLPAATQCDSLYAQHDAILAACMTKNADCAVRELAKHLESAGLQTQGSAMEKGHE
jgi:DNA-binding GntR family transcriptional regulator